MASLLSDMQHDMRTTSVDQQKFKQVSDQRRAAICKKMPKFLFFWIVSIGLYWWVQHNETEALLNSVDTYKSIQDSATLDKQFLIACMIILGGIFIAEAMLVVQLPNNDCLRKCVVGIFVFVRLLIVLGMFTAFYYLIYISVRVDQFIVKHFKQIGSGKHQGNEVNFYIAVGLACVIALFYACLLLIFIYALFSVRRLGSACKNFALWSVNFIKDYIYPEEVQDHHIAGLYSEEAEKIRLTQLQEESKEYIKKQRVSVYTSSRERCLSSFRELVCPACGKDLEDGEKVVEVDCSHRHNYHTECLKQLLKENEEKGQTEYFECKGCLETVFIVGDGEGFQSIVGQPVMDTAGELPSDTEAVE